MNFNHGFTAEIAEGAEMEEFEGLTTNTWGTSLTDVHGFARIKTGTKAIRHEEIRHGLTQIDTG